VRQNGVSMLVHGISPNSERFSQAQLSIAERPARRSVSVEMLSYCCTNNANKSRVSLNGTFSNCHVLFRYPHSYVDTSFSYAMLRVT